MRQVMHQLTDLALLGDPARAGEAARRNARIRDEGTRNMVAAALAAGSETLVAQSIDWIYAPQAVRPCDEEQALDLDAQGDRRVSVMGVVALERQVLGAPGITGTVLRYGRLYGPGTGATARPATNALHVEGAAWAALLALRHGGGVFNIAEDESEVSTARARATLGWRPGMSGLPAIAA
ncbi:dTDP-glucose 4,6-dehydratase [Achromobacter xylosoxidans]